MQNGARSKHLSEYFRTLKRHRNLVLYVWAITFVFAVAITLLTPKKFLGSSKILIERVAPSGLVRESRHALRDPAFVETQIQVIRSRVIAERVVDSLQESPEAELFFENQGDVGPGLFGEGLVSGFKKMVGLGGDPLLESAPEKVRLKLASELSEKITVRSVQDSNVLTINYLSSRPDLAARVANTVAEAYVDENHRLRVEAVRKGLDRMTKKVQEEGARLEDAEKTLYAYMASQDLLGQDSRREMSSEELSEISRALIRAEMKTRELKDLVQKILQIRQKGGDLEALTVVSSDPTLSEIKAQVLTSEQNIMELSGKYGPKHPAMKKALGDLDLLQDKKNRETQRIVNSVFNDYNLAKSNEASLREKLKAVRGNAINLNDKYVQYETLMREVETNQKLYEALLMQMKEKNVTADNQTVNVWVVEEAKVPESQFRPLVAVNMLMGLLLGLLLGVLVALVREYFDTSIVTPEGSEKVLGLKVLGVIPEGRKKDVSAEKILLEETFSVRADSYKALRTSVNLSFEGAQTSPHSLLVTSPGSGDGKTVTALNLAYAMALVDLKVLLVDADMRRPSIHDVLELKNSLGLSTFLESEESLTVKAYEDISGLDGVMQKGPIENLTIMTSGPIPPNPSELLTNGHLDKLLKNFSRHFDVVIFDSPPLISVPDSRILCSNFSGSILVTRSEVTTAEMAVRALRMLKDSNANVIGSVLNGYSQREASTYYDNYYPSTYRREPSGLSKA